MKITASLFDQYEGYFVFQNCALDLNPGGFRAIKKEHFRDWFNARHAGNRLPRPIVGVFGRVMVDGIHGRSVTFCVYDRVDFSPNPVPQGISVNHTPNH